MKKLIVGITAPQSIILLEGQLRYLSENGFDVYLLAENTEETRVFCEKENATLLPLTIKREINIIYDIRTLFQIIRIFQRIKPDVINLGTPKISLLGMIAAEYCNVPRKIYTCRGFRFEHENGLFRYILKVAEKITSKYADKVLAISDSVRELGIREGIFTKEKSMVIHKGSSNGVDLLKFNPQLYSQKQTADLKKSLGLTNEFVIGYVGRIIQRKGFIELFEAFTDIYKKDSNVKLIVCGRPYYDQISSDIIEKSKSHPGVIFTGLVPFDDVPLYMSLFDTFVLPAYWEGFGNVLIQAAAMGVPVISTNATGCKDAVLDGYNGELVRSKNVADLVKKIEKFRDRPSLRDVYGRNGIEWSKNFEGRIIWDGMVKLFSTDAIEMDA